MARSWPRCVWRSFIASEKNAGDSTGGRYRGARLGCSTESSTRGLDRGARLGGSFRVSTLHELDWFTRGSDAPFSFLPRRLQRWGLWCVYGYTDGCPGCTHRRANLAGNRPHTEPCQTRVLQEIISDDSSFGRRMQDRVRGELSRFGQDTTDFDNIVGQPQVEQDAAGQVEARSLPAPEGPREEQNDMQDQFEELMRESEEGREDIDEDSSFEDEVNNPEANNPVDVDMGDLVSERIAFIEAEVERTASSSTPGSAETYSPTRVTDICQEFGLQTGDVMDLRNGWDFTSPRHRAAAQRYIEVVKP